MTKEKLDEILSQVWMREWSADDASDAIWGEVFDGHTRPKAEQAPPVQWIKASERLPTAEDGDFTGAVWVNKKRVTDVTLLSHWMDVSDDCDFWTPTNLKKPEPPTSCP